MACLIKNSPVYIRGKEGITLKNGAKRFLAYLVYVFLVGFFVIEVESLSYHLKGLFSASFDPYYQKLAMLILVLFNILFGMLLALPHFVQTCRREGRWKIDWLPLLVICLPSLCAVAAPLIWFVFPAKLLTPLYMCVVQHLALVKAAGILFGFFLLYSLDKGGITQPHDPFID